MNGAGWVDATIERRDAVLREIMAWGAALTRDGKLPPIPAQADLLRRIYEEEMPLARLMERSQLVLHAEGPGAAHDAPLLDALKWLTSATSSVLAFMAREWFFSFGADGKSLAKRVNWRITGMAPGSVWLGIRADAPPADLLGEDAELVAQLGDVLKRLPLAARFIDDEGLRIGVHEAFRDPADLDVTLEALLKLTPSGKAGIHSVGLTSTTEGMVSLSQRERVVLAEVLRKPKSARLREGAFVGDVRSVDLDRHRMTLRTSDGAIRCAIHGLTPEMARAMLGRAARIEGRYETDSNGRPRMLYVRDAKPLEQRQPPLAG